jgi:hypothetical protein
MHYTPPIVQAQAHIQAGDKLIDVLSLDAPYLYHISRGIAGVVSIPCFQENIESLPNSVLIRVMLSDCGEAIVVQFIVPIE